MTGATRRACLGSGPLVGALRERRAQRGALTAPSTPYESPGIRLPRSMAPSSGRRTRGPRPAQRRSRTQNLKRSPKRADCWQPGDGRRDLQLRTAASQRHHQHRAPKPYRVRSRWLSELVVTRNVRLCRASAIQDRPLRYEPVQRLQWPCCI